MRQLFGYGLACGLVLASAVAQAATLSVVKGDVLVNRGDGFKAAESRVVLKSTDLVMVRLGAQAVISKSCGSIPVKPGNVVSVGLETDCSSVEAQGAPSFSPAAKVLLPLAALGGVAAVVAIVASGDKDSSASP